MPTLKQQALDHLYKRVEEEGLLHPYTVDYTFRNLSEESPFCRLLVYLYCAKADELFWQSCLDDDDEFDEPLPSKFLKLLLQRYSQIARGDESARAPLNLCDYHEHKSKEEREACAAKRAA